MIKMLFWFVSFLICLGSGSKEAKWCTRIRIRVKFIRTRSAKCLFIWQGGTVPSKFTSWNVPKAVWELQLQTLLQTVKLLGRQLSSVSDPDPGYNKI